MPLDFLDNKNVSTIITVILGLYIAVLGTGISLKIPGIGTNKPFQGPKLPLFIYNLFDNVIFRIIILFLIFVSGNKNPSVAILIAISYVLTLDYINFQQLRDKIKSSGV